MAIIRIYTGDDGQSHMQEVNLDSHPDLATLHSAAGVQFRQFEPGFFSDWHPAPRRQYVVTLSGGISIGVGDGTSRHFGPGDVLLADDLTGQGHTFSVVGDVHWLMMSVPLTD